MYFSILSYALWGEAAIAAYDAGEVAQYDGNSAASHVCRRFADATANSLRAMLAFHAAPFDPSSSNLARHVAELERSGVAMPADLAVDARVAMRALVLTASEVHGDLLTADLYHEADIAEAKDAANAVCDWMCQSLLGIPLETVQLRFHKAQENAATSAEFWNRRRLARVRNARRGQRQPVGPAAATADGEV